jgi:hypothetical protein
MKGPAILAGKGIFEAMTEQEPDITSTSRERIS